MTDSNLSPLIQQMLDPSFYPHPVQEPLQLIQTHVSYVVLTGEYAYKSKKAVDFGFLNYSTIDLRRHFCQEELRLNRQGAAELYLEVLPVTQTGTQFHLNGDGEPVEYLVKMRQFPQDTLLMALFERGELDEALLVELAKTIASFHAKAATNDYIRSFGTVEQVRQAIDQNYEQSEKYIGIAQTQEQFDGCRTYTDRLFAEHQDWFDRRIAQDKIRECHGDLHLNNICYWNDQLLLFDCIEFNEPFRFVDVMFDIAYVVRDLDSRQRQDLSTIFLNTYFEQTGDWEGLQILPFYVNRQTYVRAKILSFLLDDPAISTADKAQSQATAAQFYRQAWSYCQPQQGRIILMSGLSGAGKSTTARYLASKTQAVHLRSDAVRKHLGGIAVQDRGGSELYTPEMTEKTYARLLQLGVMLAQQGYTVILDAKYDRQTFRQAAIEQAQSEQIPLQIFYCDAPAEVRRDRLVGRKGDIADATVDLMPEQHFEPFTEAEQAYVRVLNTTESIEQQLEAAVKEWK